MLKGIKIVPDSFEKPFVSSFLGLGGISSQIDPSTTILLDHHHNSRTTPAELKRGSITEKSPTFLLL